MIVKLCVRFPVLIYYCLLEEKMKNIVSFSVATKLVVLIFAWIWYSKAHVWHHLITCWRIGLPNCWKLKCWNLLPVILTQFIRAAFNFALKIKCSNLMKTLPMKTASPSTERIAQEEEEKEYETRLIFVSIFILLLSLLTLF